MLNNVLVKRMFSFTIILITVYSVLPYPKSEGNIISTLNNTTVWWVVLTLIIMIFWQAKRVYRFENQYTDLKFVNYYLLWNLFEIIRGVFIAETYWDWKGLIGNTFALLIPLVVYGGSGNVEFQRILRRYIQIGLPLFCVFVFLISTDAYGFFLVPISFLTFFFPFLTTRWKVAVLLCAFVVIFSNLGARSNVIKFLVPFILLFIFYGRNWLSKRTLEFGRIIFVVLPFFFFTLATTGIFNVFDISSYIKGDYVEKTINKNGDEDNQDLTADTRTFIYLEVLQTAYKYDTWILGRSPARGNETEWFADLSEITGRKERLSNEVAILNIFTWTGLVGVLLYFLVFYSASHLAVNRSRNDISKMLGIYVAFRWGYSWVEDINNFSLSNLFLWLMLGICLSKTFRDMTNKDVELWIRGVFDGRYLQNSAKINVRRKII